MPLYTFIHSLLNVLVEIANKMGFKKKLRKMKKNNKNMRMKAQEKYKKSSAKTFTFSYAIDLDCDTLETKASVPQQTCWIQNTEEQFIRILKRQKCENPLPYSDLERF
jgi:hypothetical protein